MIADDLFAGAGGWDLAAEALGIHARGVENMKEARATRDAAGLTTIHDDVWTYQPDGTATGLIASPPCQTFSAAGKGAGRKALDDVLRGIRADYADDIDHLRFLGAEVGDERTALVLTPLHFALTGGYRWLAWEQVPGVLPVWEACAEKLRTVGWNVATGKLYSEQYGDPQTRIRAFLLASRDGEVALPTPTHSRYYSRNPQKLDPGVEKWVSMAEALGAFGWDPADRMVSNYGTGGDASNRGVRTGDQSAPTITSKIDRNLVLRNNNTANAAVRPIDAPAPTLYFGQRCNYVAWELANRRDSPSWIESDGPSMDEPAHTITGKGTAAWCPTPAIEGETVEDCLWVYDRPSPSIVGSFKPEVVAAPGYRTTVSRQNQPGSVRVTVAEAGVLQSFPPDFPWQGTKGKQYLQAGNAVPPLMALHALSAATGLAIPAETEQESVA